MSKIICKIDLSKIDKSKIQTRAYTNKEGKDITVKEYSFEVIELKEGKVIKETPQYKMVKTHFIKESQTKEEKESGVDGNTLGEGIMFESSGQPELPKAKSKTPYSDNIPF